MPEEFVTTNRDNLLRMQGQMIETWQDPPSSQLAPIVAVVRRGLGHEIADAVEHGLATIVMRHLHGRQPNMKLMWEAEMAATALLQMLDVRLVPLCYFVVECDRSKGTNRVTECHPRFYCVKPSRLC